MSEIKGASKELQQISLVALSNDPYLLAKCIGIIDEGYYVNQSYKLIFRALSDFYKKYSTIPSKEELKVMIGKFNLEDYDNIEDLDKSIDSIYETEISSEDYMYENVIDFIRRVQVEKSLKKAVTFLEKGDIDLGKVGEELSRSININFSKAMVMNLADISSISSAREEALGSLSNPTMIKFFIDGVNNCMQYKAIIPGTLNMVTAPPGRGKTTLLINQGIAAAKQGFKTLHIFLGDMTRFDGLLRYLSCFTGVNTSSLVELAKEGDEKLAAFVQKWNMSGILSNIDIISYAADELTANQLVEDIMSIQKQNRVHFHQMIIDYDENISEEADNMYKSGGQIYNKMALFATINKSVIFIASQPKTEYWKQEVIPLEAASESSKKQKIIDLMLTMGKPSKSSGVATLTIAKNRRGIDCRHFRLKIDGENARITHITEDEYTRLKSIERSSDGNQ